MNREQRRQQLEQRVAEAVARVDNGQVLFDQFLEDISARNTAMIEAHGDPKAGGLTYGDLARITGLSRGRVIQICQGKSKFSKVQQKRLRESHSGT